MVNDRVDDLLARSEYGERMATYWLDLVRFASTVGYHGDQDHPAAPYRNYVIDSFNGDLPLDQFTREQLGGDLLETPTNQQLVATGYNRLLQTSHEGGIQRKEYLAIYAADRVRNVSAVWMGATVVAPSVMTTNTIHTPLETFTSCRLSSRISTMMDLPATVCPPSVLLTSRHTRKRSEKMSLLEKEISELGQASGHEDDLKAWSAKLEGLRAKLARERNKQKKAALQKELQNFEKSEVAGVPKGVLAGYLENSKDSKA